MRFSSFGLYLLLVGGVSAANDATNIQVHGDLSPRQPPPPPPPMKPGWKPDKPQPKPIVDPPKAKVLYRGEYFRGPDEVKKAGSFDSHAKRIFEGKHPDYKDRMKAELFKKGSSLYEHAVFKNPVSSYVPTSRSLEEALKFAKSADKVGYLYKIRASPDMVDVVGSLGGEDYFKHFKEQEVAGVYEIPWHRVESWQEVRRNAKTGEYERGKEVPNEDFIEPSDGEAAYLSHPELAGWPEGSVALENEFWAPYKDVPVEGMLNEHLLKYRHGDNVEKFKKWRGNEDWSILPCSGSRKRTGATDACALIRNEPSKVPNGETEKPPSTSGDKPVNSPGEEKVPAEITEGKLAELAEVSEKEFIDSTAARGLTLVATRKWSVDPRDIRAKLLGYKRLTADSPKIRSMKGGLSGGLDAVGVVAWVGGIVDAFVKDATALDRVAAIASIFPLVGCGFSAISEAQKGDVDVLDKVLCISGDILLFTPLAPFGFAFHLFRMIVSQFKPQSQPTKESSQKARDQQWQRFLDDNVFTYFYSDGSVSGKSTFRDKLNSSLAIETLAVLSEGADSIAVGNISAQIAMEASNSDKSKIQAGAMEAATKIRAGASREIIRRQRELLLGLPNSLKECTSLSLKPIAEQFNKDFIAELTSPEMVKKYTPITATVPDTPGVDLSGKVRDELNATGTHLTKTPPVLPKLFDIAYVLGQSKGLEGIDPLTLSPRDFLKAQIPELSDDRLDFYSLHHALQVSKSLQGQIKEEQLSNLWPAKDTKDLQRFRILLALKFGKTFEEQKIKWAQGLKGAGGALLSEKEVRFSTHPNIPPRKGGQESFAYIGLILGLSAERVRSLPQDQQTLDYKDLVNNEELIKAMMAQAMASSGRKDTEGVKQ
ncbi:hypothetical protein QQS21_008851 [Conoideocrella luteorostrata]|uniref:Heat-labile enterotoxin, A chain n=1 Tax=Conoideocrella luteorostrata TaxID=1105319 RepID=A0AAJ0CKQ5_9HYPO|nr:hypothetical protein QQS21_008851 [Conoideocrella luteorostrata]